MVPPSLIIDTRLLWIIIFTPRPPYTRENRDPGRCHSTCHSSKALRVVKPRLDTRWQEAHKVNAYKVSSVVETSPA